MNDECVYSTGSGDLRKNHKTKKNSSLRIQPFPQDGCVRVRREVKGRGGKTVSAVYGLLKSDSELTRLASQLKQRCGTGGAVKDGVILIQGDKIAQIINFLTAQGFSVKKGGG